jgi:DNA-binding response OmpR family regulator
MAAQSTAEARTILIVEDDAALVRGLTLNLEIEGYRVLAARDAESALTILAGQRPDLIILDVMLPRMSGFELCRTLRESDTHTPIVMLTARGEELDRVLGLELGADDYVTKPFSVRELLARIKAVLRRSQSASSEPDSCAFGAAIVDFGRLEAQLHGSAIHLAPKEFGLLRFLVANEGRPISRSELLDQVWGYDAPLTTRTVDSHIASLRGKLEVDPARPAHILTVHGVGYKFLS